MKWDAALEAIQDRRKQGRIPTSVIVRAVLAMCLCRLGSLNALAQTAGSGLWRRWLGQALPSSSVRDAKSSPSITNRLTLRNRWRA